MLEISYRLPSLRTLATKSILTSFAQYALCTIEFVCCRDDKLTAFADRLSGTCAQHLHLRHTPIRPLTSSMDDGSFGNQPTQYSGFMKFEPVAVCYALLGPVDTHCGSFR